jgi:hypothetical protein
MKGEEGGKGGRKKEGKKKGNRQATGKGKEETEEERDENLRREERISQVSVFSFHLSGSEVVDVEGVGEVNELESGVNRRPRNITCFFMRERIALYR